jgi:hypothetical protein
LVFRAHHCIQEGFLGDLRVFALMEVYWTVYLLFLIEKRREGPENFGGNFSNSFLINFESHPITVSTTSPHHSPINNNTIQNCSISQFANARLTYFFKTSHSCNKVASPSNYS